MSNYRPRKRTKNVSLAKRRATVAACTRRWRERENLLATLAKSEHPLAPKAAEVQELKDWYRESERQEYLAAKRATLAAAREAGIRGAEDITADPFS